MTLIAQHRGYTKNGLRENTIRALKEGFQLGAEMAEFDVHITKDDHWILHHDKTILKKYAIADLTSDKIDKISLENNYEISYLDDVFKEFKSEILNVECKSHTEESGKKLAKYLLYKDVLDQVNVSSFYKEPLMGLRKTSSHIKISYLYFFWFSNYWKILHKKINLFSVNPYYKFLTQRRVNSIAKENIKIHTWTVNSTKSIQKMIHMGVDVIITDDPKHAINIREASYKTSLKNV
ncbi:MAG: glycerophosphodiester phosphodiesterase [Candidatus Heimdallarchaeota archaeon]|nr:glycerophosphodiester phosphodiesterase [Candidatus Heimdallarchaeota archaeon]MDH5645105.1 glycerophosphodiester phosphodiesterase [Candidatus Heimdallarchaeota archaeon]